ncbi:MAG: hypothetical protein KJO07_04215 [Deltaproteobacteria bacterium]|nr:hypothetical protein [Deltaproteobacteria bacterium]
MRAPLLSFLAASAVALACPTADADLLSGTLRVQGGGAYGKGLSGDLKDEAFEEGVRGGTYGVRAGVEVFFINLWIGHDQYLDPDGFQGTWTTLPMIGFDTEFDLGAGAIIPNPTKKMKRGPSKWSLHLGFGAGFGLGTGQQVEPPLDNGQVSDKGFMFEGEVGINRKLGDSFSLGVAVPLQYRIMFKNDADSVANDPDDRYTSAIGSVLVNLRFKLKLL